MYSCLLCSFGKQLGGRRGCECITLEPSEMIVVSKKHFSLSSHFLFCFSQRVLGNSLWTLPSCSSLWFYAFFLRSFIWCPSCTPSSFALSCGPPIFSPISFIFGQRHLIFRVAKYVEENWPNNIEIQGKNPNIPYGRMLCLSKHVHCCENILCF